MIMLRYSIRNAVLYARQFIAGLSASPRAKERVSLNELR